jgi:hypothetical protein
MQAIVDRAVESASRALFLYDVTTEDAIRIAVLQAIDEAYQLERQRG